MVPNHTLRLQAMLRAMTEVIIPALDPSQRLALDQAQILTGNLRLLIDQTGKTGDYDRVELAETRSLGRALAHLLARPADRFDGPAPAGEADLRDLLLATKQATDELIRAALAADDPDIRSAANGLVLDQAERQLLRERVWFRAAGFEIAPEALPTMDDVLRETVATP